MSSRVNRHRAGVLVVMGLLAIESCKVDPGEATVSPATPATSTATTTTTGRRSATTRPARPAPKPQPATTTTQPAPPPAMVVAPGVPVDLRQDLATAGAVRLVPASGGRGHLLVGWEQEERQPTSPRIWESADGLRWTEAPAPVAPDEQTVVTVGDGAWIGTTLAVGGATNTHGTGPRAGVWLAQDGRNFDAPPELPLGEADSGILAMNPTRSGLVVAGWVDDSNTDHGTAFVAVRSHAGEWRRAQLPQLPGFGPNGIAASGSTIVVTGAESESDPPRAVALVSTDDGRTFEVADTTAVDGGTAAAIGPVAATPEGFVAVACAPSPTGHVTALVRSDGGKVWSRQDIQIVADEGADRPQLLGAGCSSLFADGSRVLVGVVDLGGWVVSVEPSGRATAVPTARGYRQLAASGPFVAPTPVGTVVVSNDHGGFTPSMLESGALGRGLPAGAPQVDGLALHGDVDAPMLEVVMSPDIEERAGGSWARSSYRQWFRSDDAESFARPLAWPRKLYDVESTPFGIVGLATADDPADAGRGPNSATRAFVRDEQGQWRSAGLAAGGAGGEILADLVAYGTAAVGVGTTSRRDPDTDVPTWAPLVRSTLDAVTWTEESVPLPAGAVGGLSSACTMGDQVVASGWQVLDGVESTLVAVRDPAGSWSIAAPTGLPASSWVAACAPDGSRVLRQGHGAHRSSVFVSTDGITFSEADLSARELTDSTFHHIEPHGAGFIAVGTKVVDGGDVNGALWTSPDGWEWAEVPLDGIDGFGAQQPVSAELAPDGSLVVAGYDLGAPTVWTVPAGAF